MKPQPFNLELWLHLHKPDIVWTRNKNKVKSLVYYDEISNTSTSNILSYIENSWVLSGIIINKDGKEKRLALWSIKGEHHVHKLINPWDMFGPDDLMLHLPEKK